jgi:hypothetical protein
MKWPFFGKCPVTKPDWIARYPRLRKVGRELNLELVKQLPKPAVPECGKKLGLVKAGVLIINNDDEIAVLYDYCLHHHRRDSKNVIERRLDQSGPASDAQERTMLESMLKFRFSAFRVTEIKPRQGATVLDLVHGMDFGLVDIGLSETGSEGIILIGRLLPVDDFYMSSGTLIPLTEAVYQDKIVPILKKFFPDSQVGPHAAMSAAQEAAYIAQMIRVSLHAGGSDNVFYTDMEYEG